MIKQEQADNRLRITSVIFLLLAVVIIARLFILQVFQYDYYSTFALSTHEIYKKIHARRGQIYFKDARSGLEYPAAVNRQYYNVFAVPREIEPDQASTTAHDLSQILKFDESAEESLRQKLSKHEDPYEPVANKAADDVSEIIAARKFKGIYQTAAEYRYYPEDDLAANILGFKGVDKDGNPKGLYGLEGYWDEVLAGESGFLLGERGAKGSWISLAGRTEQRAVNGADAVLTIDRTLQYKACERLREGWKEYEAKSASLVIMDPKTGAILAMCSLPDFNPNEYSKTEDLNAFNNTAIFTAYEPGSVFKPITMAAGIDLGLVEPYTQFEDPCERKIDDFTIHNALDKCYGRVTMTQVLENSINTGMIWVEEKIGHSQFNKYVKKFGFGSKTGITLDTEVAGEVSSLEKPGDVWGAVASFGQGITATPIQLAMAYAALANQGQLLKPYVVEELRYDNGRREKTRTQVVEQIISPRTAKLITGMLVSVVENGHGKGVKLENYYLAGKTGTAQIPGKGGYTEDTNHTFCGYAPANEPRFVLVVKFEAPKRAWAEETAIPVFKDIAEFALKYYGVKGDR